MVDIQLNGETRSISATTSLTQLVEQQRLQDKRIAIELNGEVVPRSQFSHIVLRAGDCVEIVHAIGGG
jgi:sulfur carrier protein